MGSNQRAPKIQQVPFHRTGRIRERYRPVPILISPMMNWTVHSRPRLEGSTRETFPARLRQSVLVLTVIAATSGFSTVDLYTCTPYPPCTLLTRTSMEKNKRDRGECMKSEIMASEKHKQIVSQYWIFSAVPKRHRRWCRTIELIRYQWLHYIFPRGGAPDSCTRST